MRRLFFVTAVLLLVVGSATAQEPAFREDLRFAEALRARGDNRLALEFLKKLEAGAPPELLKELPLEFAKTGLRVASEEPETARRLARYKEAKENFQKFIDNNPTHPRVAEANVDIARVLNLQGKTELSRAMLSDDPKTQRDLAAQARRTLELAAAKLQAAVTLLEANLKALPDPDGMTDAQKKKEALAARTAAENELKQTEFELANNLYDQSMTYLGGFGAEQASALLVKSRDRLQPLADGDPKHPITWKARAWVGRIMRETDTDEKASKKFIEVLDATTPAAAEGRRLALYFSMLAVHEKPNAFLLKEADKKRGANAVIITDATAWRSRYSRFLNTPEGIGVTFLLAQVLSQEADIKEAKKNKPLADKDRTLARALLREVESSENEFTDRAKRLKIQTIARQGTFKVPIAKLKSWEDFYVRAQFEAISLTRDPKEKRKEHIDSIVQALQLGMKTAEVKAGKVPSMELNAARTMLAFWLLNTGKLAEAIEIGETFARNDPNSSQAEMAAVYALQAYARLIDEKKAKDEDTSETRTKMFLLAQTMEDRWSKGLPGELARHTVGLMLLKEQNYAEGIKKLSLISPGYGSYTIVRYQLADAAFKADADIRASKDAIDLIPGDRPGDYLKRAMAALDSMPESALGADPITNYFYVAGKAKLGRELFKYKRFQQMKDMATHLLGRLAKLTLSEDEEKDKTFRNQMRYELVDVTLFADYGLANEAFQAGDHAKAAALLDPLIDKANKEGTQERFNLQKSPQLATAMLSIALKANIQLGKIDRTDLVLDVLDKVSAGEAAEASSTNILKLLAYLIRGQVEEMRKKGDKEDLQKAIKGYSSILDKRIKKQSGKLTPDFIRVLADCYSSMGGTEGTEEHAKAAAVLAGVPDPKAAPDSPEGKTYRAVQLTMIRELRLSKTADGLKKARQVLDGILGTEKKPGWGRKDFFALQAQGLLLEDEGKYAEGFAHWTMLVKNLSKVAGRGGPAKEFYLESYYHMVYCYLKNGLSKPDKEAHEKVYHQAGVKIFDLEQSWEDFGSDASKQRFTDLLAKEPALKEQYELAKAKKKR